MNGLDPEEAQRMRNLILAHDATSAVVVSSHNLGDLERFCTHVAFARDGRVVKTVRLADLAAAGTTLESEYFQIERSLTEDGRF